MSNFNINDLPREMLAKVFRFLDVVNLKNATLACTLWKNIIESTCRWSLKLNFYEGKFKYANNAELKMNFIMTTNRKFGTIEISGGRLSGDSIILLTFQKHGFNVVQLILLTSHVDLAAFVKLLSLTPNLTLLDMDVDIFDSVNDMQLMGQILPELKKLEILYINVEDQRIVQCFRKTKLRKMKIWDNRLNHPSSLVDFISSQNTLTSLAVDIGSNSASILGELGKLKVPFRLTQLRLTGHVYHDGNLLRFFESQAKNLVELEIGSELLSFLYECIIESMPKLNTLSVVAPSSFFHFGNDFYSGPGTNCSVRTIKLMFYDNDDDWLRFLGKFFEKLPNLRNLISSHGCYFNKKDLIMAHSLDKLESLAIKSYFNEPHLDCVKFSNLKTLHIQHLKIRINWNEFTKIHSRLTELTIENMDDHSYLTSHDIDQMTTNVDLQHMRLGVGFVADDRFFEIIRTKCKTLKVLELHKSCLQHGLVDNVGTNVLRLCDDFGCSQTFRSIFYSFV